MPIPAFDGNGLLPAGRHASDPAEILAALVVPFTTSTSRPTIYSWWHLHLQGLKHLTTIISQWVNGSFVTNKVDPGDMDIMTIFDGPTYDALPAHIRAIIGSMTLHKYTQQYWRCDAYGVAIYPAGHPMHDPTNKALTYWNMQWGHTKGGVDAAGNVVPSMPKGYLEVS